MDIKFAVESAHDANILDNLERAAGRQPQLLNLESYLSFMVSLLTLEPPPKPAENAVEQPAPEEAEQADEEGAELELETLRMREQFLQFKMQLDELNRSDADYFAKKEDLIFKIYCELKGIDPADQTNSELELNEAMAIE